jgi:hypothetical protein
MVDEDWERRGEIKNEFYALIGRCIAAWAQVDDSLFLVFRDCLGPYDQSAIIYYRLPGLDVRFGLTDEIVRSVLPRRPRKSGAHEHPSVKAWIKAKGDYNDLLAVRRRIAHHPVAVKRIPQFWDTATSYWDVPPFSHYEIYVSRHEALRERSAGLAPLDIADLKKHLLAVNALSERLRLFLSDVLIKQHEELTRRSPPRSRG